MLKRDINIPVKELVYNILNSAISNSHLHSLILLISNIRIFLFFFQWVRKDDTDLVVKIDGPHQFAPVITAKYELKSKINTVSI